MSEVMTRAEAEALYPNEWVLMDNSDPAADGNYKGRIIAHARDRAAVVREAMAQTLPKKVAVFFSGPVVPPGMKVLL